MVTALDGTGQRLEADVKGAAIAGHTQDCHIVPALDFQGLGNARGKRGQAHQNGLQRGDTQPVSSPLPVRMAEQLGGVRVMVLEPKTSREARLISSRGPALAGRQTFAQQIQFSHSSAPHLPSDRSRWAPCREHSWRPSLPPWRTHSPRSAPKCRGRPGRRQSCMR